MRKWIITGIGVLGILSLTAFTTIPYNLPTVNNLQSDEITAVINKNTTEKDLEDLKTFFSENGIELRIKKVSFNEQNEITSLSLVLIKEGSKSQYSSSSNTPISEIKLGYKSGNLFITNAKTFDISSLKSLSNFNYPNIDMDSLMKKHNFAFDFNFDEENDSLFFKGQFDVQKLKDQIMQSFSFSKDENGNFAFNGHAPNFQHHKSQKYNFIDNPDIEKLIIIDGKEADFNTLDTLAKSDQLEDVDFLKPQIAISIYGDKAKDGAIIAITKK